MENYNFRILSEKKKQFEITYNDKTLKFQLKIKRAFTVMKKLLQAYPEKFDIIKANNQNIKGLKKL